MISLIKSGAFDKLEESFGKELNIHPRIAVMAYYLSIVSEPKSKLTLQNFNGLIQRGLIPDSLDLQKRIFSFNKYLKDFKKCQYYVFDSHGIAESFYSKHFDLELLDVINGVTCIKQTTWDKLYKKEMDVVREWLKENQEQTLKELNFS